MKRERDAAAVGPEKGGEAVHVIVTEREGGVDRKRGEHPGKEDLVMLKVSQRQKMVTDTKMAALTCSLQKKSKRSLLIRVCMVLLPLYRQHRQDRRMETKIMSLMNMEVINRSNCLLLSNKCIICS